MTLPQRGAGSTRLYPNGESVLCVPKEVGALTDQNQQTERKSTIAQHRRLGSNPDPEETLPKACYTCDIPETAELSDASIQSLSQPVDRVNNDSAHSCSDSAHKYSDRLLLDDKAIPLPLECEDTSSSEKSYVARNDRAPLRRQDTPQPADLREMSHNIDQIVHPRRNTTSATTREKVPQSLHLMPNMRTRRRLE